MFASWFVAVAVVTAFCTSAQADFPAYQAAVLADNPTGFWSTNLLSGTTIPDNTVNARNLTLGSDPASWAPLANGPMVGAGTSIDFTPYPHGNSNNTYTGVGAYGTYATPGPFTLPNNFTIEMWVKPDHAGQNAAGDWGVVWGHRGFAFGMRDTGQPHFVTWGAHDYVSSGVVADDTWAMVDVVFNGLQADFYIDGAFSDSQVFTSNGFTGGGDVFGLDHRMRLFNADANTFNNPFVGGIGQVAFFPTMLTSGQIAAHFAAAQQTQAAVPEPSTLAIWTLVGLGMAAFSYCRMTRKQ